nr:condensation domain-containing protein [uncultured Chitinophaga sp.]
MNNTFQEHLLRSLQLHQHQQAIESPGRSVSYGVLLHTANLVTADLLTAGAEDATIVGIHLDNKVDVIAAIIGVINARCVFVLIDTAWPADRKRRLIKDLDLKHMISAGNIQPPDADIPFYRLMEDILKADSNTAVNISYPAFDAADSLYIYFTSGSTGNPKGIVGSNKGLLQFIQWEIDTFQINSETRVSQFISPYFDAFLRDVFAPLLAGGTICIPPATDDFFAGEKVTAWIDKAEINIIHCVPSLFRRIRSADLTSGHFKQLRYILMSGEKIFPSELTNWYHIFSDRIRLVNFYGATETTMIRSFYLIQPEDVRLEKMPVGIPIRDTEILISADGVHPCEKLLPGEVYIISPYVSKGYLNNQELTHERFLPRANGAMAFKTGDKARMLSDGKCVLLGREDRLVKARGIRIELDEIENTLIRSGWLKHAAVVWDETDEIIIAFIIVNEKGKTLPDAEATVLRFLKAWLPVYMVPAGLQLVEEYPLLGNGKIDYKKLLKIHSEQHIIAPADKFEEEILHIWQEVLGRRRFSTVASFYRSGGNSLTMMALIGRINTKFHVRVSLAQMFRHVTIQQQAILVKQSMKDDLMVITKASEKRSYRLSAAQKRIYYHYELDRNTTAFNLPVAFEVTGEPDTEKIRSVLQQLVQRHEGLRTRFFTEDSRLLQEVVDVEVPLEEIDAGEDDLHQAVEKFIRPFRLDSPPLIRCALMKGENNRRLFVADLHHIICDGQSQQNLYADFLALYTNATLTPLHIQYKDYAEWEHTFRTTQEYIACREFWLKQFEGEVPRITFPVIAAGEEAGSMKGGNTTFSVEKTVLQPLKAQFNRDDITDFQLLFSLFFIFIAQITGEDDLVIGVAASGRMQQEVEPLLGMFVKTLPIRYSINQDISFPAFVTAFNRCFLQAHSRQLYDLSDIVQELNSRKSARVDGLSDVMFVFQNFRDTAGHAASAPFTAFDFTNNTSKNPLTLYAGEAENHFEFRFEYATRYFTPNDMELWVLQFKALMGKIAQNPGAKMVDHMSAPVRSSSMEENSIRFEF